MELWRENVIEFCGSLLITALMFKNTEQPSCLFCTDEKWCKCKIDAYPKHPWISNAWGRKKYIFGFSGCYSSEGVRYEQNSFLIFWPQLETACCSLQVHSTEVRSFMEFPPAITAKNVGMVYYIQLNSSCFCSLIAAMTSSYELIGYGWGLGIRCAYRNRSVHMWWNSAALCILFGYYIFLLVWNLH